MGFTVAKKKLIKVPLPDCYKVPLSTLHRNSISISILAPVIRIYLFESLKAPNFLMGYIVAKKKLIKLPLPDCYKVPLSPLHRNSISISILAPVIRIYLQMRVGFFFKDTVWFDDVVLVEGIFKAQGTSDHAGYFSAGYGCLPDPDRTGLVYKIRISGILIYKS